MSRRGLQNNGFGKNLLPLSRCREDAQSYKVKLCPALLPPCIYTLLPFLAVDGLCRESRWKTSPGG